MILIGGTMQPVDNLLNQLTIHAKCNTDRIVQYSYGHIISPSQLNTFIIDGDNFDFRFQVGQQNIYIFAIISLLIYSSIFYIMFM